MSAAPCLSILVWSEDSAGGAEQVVMALARKMLAVVDPYTQTHRIAWEPLNDEAARALKGARWKGAQGRNAELRGKVVDLRRSIATKLMERAGGVPGFVFFHVDGDTAWEDRARSDARAHFDALTGAVKQLVEPGLRNQGRSAELSSVMSRLRVIMPFHSIEAWLFQNTPELMRLCQASCGKHMEMIQRWAGDRGSLDELAGDDQPKHQMPCVGPDDHLALARNGYPVDAVFNVNKSYAATVMSLLECEALSTALARTYETPPTQDPH